MAVTENDLELLEGYLDDALEISAVETLQSRLASDATLVAAMGEIRNQRVLRRSIFEALEPGDAKVDALVVKVLSSTVAQGRATTRRLPAWYFGAAAACLAIGFFGRGLYDRSPGNSSNPDPSLVRHDQGIELQKIASYQVTLRDETGNVVAVQRFDSMEKANEFAADVTRWQSRSERLVSGRFVLSADRF